MLVETSNAYARSLLSGIISCIRTNESWSVYLPEQHGGAISPTSLRTWKGDGVIARIETDDAAIARLAFNHFRERGFEHFPFCGESEFNGSNWREESFTEAVRNSGHRR